MKIEILMFLFLGLAFLMVRVMGERVDAMGVWSGDKRKEGKRGAGSPQVRVNTRCVGMVMHGGGFFPLTWWRGVGEQHLGRTGGTEGRERRGTWGAHVWRAATRATRHVCRRAVTSRACLLARVCRDGFGGVQRGGNWTVLKVDGFPVSRQGRTEGPPLADNSTCMYALAMYALL